MNINMQASSVRIVNLLRVYFGFNQIMKGRLEGRVAIVTGASRGIGRAIALAFSREGANVVVNYRQERAKAKEVVEEIEGFNGNAINVQADVGNFSEVIRMVEKTLDEFGGVDILVNNAGVRMGSGSLLEFNEEEFDPMWRVNVKGVLNCARAVAPYMIEQHYGKMVNISSIGGIGTAVLPGNYLYGTTKAAVIIMTKRLALELGRYGINVNAIAPGMILTEMAKSVATEQVSRFRYFEEHSILGRLGDPDEVANVALFLASDESSFITGQVITVDGGRFDFITHSM